jgi:ribonucleoside-triphosphate reductase
VFFSKNYKWESEGDLPIFKATGSVYSPIFQKRIGEDTDYLADPWVDGAVKGTTTGVLDVVTLNVPRLAYGVDDEDDFIAKVGELTEVAVEGLEEKRAFLEEELEDGRLPATKRVVDSFDGFFCGVGVVGVHEAIMQLLEKGIESMQGKAVAYKILEEINRRLKAHWEETGHLFCRIAEPSDGISYRFAELDRVKCPGLKASGVDVPFYTGSTCLRVDYSDDLWDAMEHQKKLQTLYTGGSIFNVYLGRGISDIVGVKTLARRMVERTALPCFSFSPTLSASDSGRFERLSYWYKPVIEMVAGELEEVRLRRPYAVASGW